MGLFRKEKEEWVNVSGEILIKILKEAKNELKTRVNDGYSSREIEIMFDYDNNVHFIGVKYDRKTVKKMRLKEFDESLSYVFLNKQEFKTINELYNNAMIGNELLKDITDGIFIPPEFAEMVDGFRISAKFDF